ncbi:hypothetical protein DYB32_005223 [Aphanomyces invadans]|uniref:Uncharacterized protein n=1 Tax=Aphanomyces invadans TaxID=157072 RepID=A0A418AV78_9STRA|nr:hypothetical protein DYB32_005223 [Aphanomyces invadans]
MDGWTPLHYACANRDVASLCPLLNAGSEVNAVDELGYTPLHLLCKNVSGKFTGISELVSNGASVNIVSTDDKRVTPLQLLCMNESITLDALSALVKANADVRAVDADGNTALHSLCANPSVSDALLAIYLDRPAPLNAQNQFKATPLHYLCQNARVSPTMLKQLLDARADPNLPDNNASVLVAEHPSDKTLLAQWSASMSEWRQTIVRAFLTLVNPRLWESYMKTFDRRVPDDVVKMQAKVEAIWTKFPQLSQRRERLGAVQELY